ncbi:hypothetical protein B0H21DRAFT_353450 [Amylocystis lapponica]|nr:hypothetical protein B0H21DRAFT_353450 [Amylocystis lapponica]
MSPICPVPPQIYHRSGRAPAPSEQHPCSQISAPARVCRTSAACRRRGGHAAVPAQGVLKARRTTPSSSSCYRHRPATTALVTLREQRPPTDRIRVPLIMFPLMNDFNLVCCALATVSAAVGYNVSRRRRSVSGHRLAGPEKAVGRSFFTGRRGSSASASCASDATMETDDTAPPASLCPSPSANENENVRASGAALCRSQLIHALQAYDDTEPGTHKRKDREDDDDAADPVPGRFDVGDARPFSPPKKRCRTPPDARESAPVKMEEEAEPTKLEPPPAAPAPPAETVNAVQDTENSERPAPPVPISLPPLPSSYSIPAAKPSSAFAAFENARPMFSFLPNAASAAPKPIWCIGTPAALPPTPSSDGPHNVAEGESGSAPPAGPPSGGTCDPPREPRKNEDPLAAHTYEKGTHSTVTGEEDEEVRAEAKGAKVFIKRGAREFSDGILGHAKLLAHRASGEQRILFRREPIWKVSMSVRLRPAVRCTFDAEQGILRVALKEADPEAEADARAPGAEQVVVYALKRGKASKADFAAFARAVIEGARTCGPAASAGSTAAA